MAKTPQLYSRLTRSPLQIGTCKSLWLAADHFMQVDSSGYAESYQRFQFSDVQAFFIQSSNRRLYWNLFWILWAVVAAIPFLWAAVDGEMPGASTVFLGIAVVFLLWNNLLGPSCRVYVVTKVQTVHLAGVARRRKADKVLGRLQPLIEQAQSSLSVPAATGPAAPAAAAQGASPVVAIEREMAPLVSDTASPVISTPVPAPETNPPAA
jgi:hypothetical protein